MESEEGRTDQFCPFLIEGGHAGAGGRHLGSELSWLLKATYPPTSCLSKSYLARVCGEGDGEHSV